MARTLISQTQLDRRSGKIAYWTVLTLVVAVFTLVFLGPLYWLVTGGLKSTAEVIQNPPTLFPEQLHPDTYATAWSKLRMGRLLFNTLYYAFGALAFQLVLDVAAAYALSKLRPVLGNLILGMMLATLMIPAAVLIVPQYLTVLDLPLLHLNLINTPWAIWLPTVANAFNIFLLKRFFDSIPEDLMAAAAMDGATPLRALWSIVLPMSRPILGVVSIFAVVNVWKDFLWPMLVQPDPANQPLNIGINSLSTGVPQNVIIAALAIASAPTVVVFLVFQRNIMAGLTSGSLKG
ncbi:carbohydrate ABC transporter permease [Kitasatospora atroaurantiaca]|uniref:Carbohydrate ABC transporter membrane protein 2 (CUT1 family) n=1 Tax=Kitasatospora atroaurantiaca TaxID=285545 RepID=A0A561EYX3_9ACTN|nr:carbohydrate ABC transporter permease [Kitasatospora atroaurantiaca]TWE20808.1 carbohydrate ABC transporter membrane protein 2 (CUT1 family) [Kitasatospora atroaurantiaca]